MYIAPLQAAKNTQTNNKQNKPNATQRTIFQETVADKIKEKTKDSNVWKELANRYNVENTTFEGISQIAKSLYDAGEITLQDVMTMIFDYGKATADLKNKFSHISSQFSMFETTPDSLGNMNWLFEFEARAQKNLDYGNILSYQNNIRILDILKQINDYKQEA